MKNVLVAFILAIVFSLAVCADGSRQQATPIIPEGWQSIYDQWGFSPALRVGDTIYVSGMIVRLEGEGSYQEQYANGLRSLFSLLERILAAEGASLDDVVEITSFHTDLPRQMRTALDVRMELMQLPHPAWTAVGTTSLADPEGVTEIKFTVQLSQE